MDGSRYLLIELQDSDGNVLYPHTEVKGIWLPDGTSMYDCLLTESTDEKINNIFDMEEDNTTENNTEEVTN